MTKRIQAYFSTEDAAEGAKTALIPYGVEGIESVGVDGPPGYRRECRRNILIPLAPFNTSATAAGGVYSAGGATGPLTGAAIVPGLAVDNDLGRTDDERTAGEVHSGSELNNSDLENLHYVMDLKVAENHYNEVVEVLRGKQAYVEIFD
jgi:hypothetical protein